MKMCYFELKLNIPLFWYTLVVIVSGGWHASTENTNKVECYDPERNEWLQKAPMLERRYRPGVAVIGSKIYVCGGEEGWDRYNFSYLFI
jgi:hypothetical protein